MAQYTCRLYSNSGFNAVNIPDSPAILDTVPFTDLPVLDLNQERFLPLVRVKASWDTVRDADYCKVGDFYYFVTNATMSSGDVAVLTLAPDFVTSAGGVAALQFLDGVTSRVHVSDDSYGLYGEADPFMAPAYDMDVRIDISSGDFSNNGTYTFVETTLNLPDLGQKVEDFTQEAATAIDPNDPDKYVTYPLVQSIDGRTVYSADTHVLPSPYGQVLYGALNDDFSRQVREGIAAARALGIEQSISGVFAVPAHMIASGSLDTLGRVRTLIGMSGSRACSIPFIYGSAQNNRIFYGSQTPYYLATAAGNVLEAPAEAVYGGGAAPTISWMVDPRRTGRPYYRFRTMNGQTLPASGGLDIFRNGVAGKQWRSVPMVFTEKSGGLLEQARFRSNQIVETFKAQNTLTGMMITADQQRQMGDLGFVSAGIGAASAGVSLGMGIGTGNPQGIATGISGAAGSLMSGEAIWLQNQFNAENNARNINNYMAEYNAAKNAELQSFMINNQVTAPTVAFQSDPDLMADISGNGFVVYRTVYKARDIARIDRILNVFGYKVTKVLETSDFFNRQYFNYVEASVSVQRADGLLPKWWADGASAQLANGVRVWHVKPSAAYYASNPIA